MKSFGIVAMNALISVFLDTENHLQVKRWQLQKQWSKSNQMCIAQITFQEYHLTLSLQGQLANDLNLLQTVGVNIDFIRRIMRDWA